MSEETTYKIETTNPPRLVAVVKTVETFEEDKDFPPFSFTETFFATEYREAYSTETHIEGGEEQEDKSLKVYWRVDSGDDAGLIVYPYQIPALIDLLTQMQEACKS